MVTIDMEKTGKKIKEIRKRSGMTIRQEILQWTQVFRDISNMSVLEQRSEAWRKGMVADGSRTGK